MGRKLMDFHWLVACESLWSNWHFVDNIHFRGIFGPSEIFLVLQNQRKTSVCLFERYCKSRCWTRSVISFSKQNQWDFDNSRTSNSREKVSRKMGPDIFDKTGSIQGYTRVGCIANYIILTIQYVPDAFSGLFCVPSCKDCKQLMVSNFQSRSESWLSRDSTAFGCSNLLFLILLFFLHSNLNYDLKIWEIWWYLTYVSNDRPSWWHCKNSYDFHPIIPTNVYGFFSQ